MYAQDFPVYEDAKSDEQERRERERLHAEDLAAFDAALGLPPEAFMTRREWYEHEMKTRRTMPLLHGTFHYGANVIVYHDGTPTRFFDDRVPVEDAP